MCAWMLSAGELVKPLMELITTRVKQSKVIHTDDTRVPVQDPAVADSRPDRAASPSSRRASVVPGEASGSGSA